MDDASVTAITAATSEGRPLRRVLHAARFEWHMNRSGKLLARARARHARDASAGRLIDRATAHLDKAERLRLRLERSAS